MDPVLRTSFPPQSLIIEGLACRRGGRSLFRDLSLSVDNGGAMVLTGANGAGKTSLLRIVAGLLEAEAGRVAFGSSEMSEERREMVHLIGTSDALRPTLTPLEHLEFWQGTQGGYGHTDAFDILAALGLRHLADTAVSYFSAGQRRRLAFSRLLSARRPLWLLDEPTNALDTSGRGMLMHLIAAHRAHGGIVMVATHDTLDLPDAQRLTIGAGVAEMVS